VYYIAVFKYKDGGILMMGQLGLFSVATVSFPEAIVFSITILLAIGRRDLLNMKVKSNVFKFIFVVIIMTMIPVTMRHFSDYFFSIQAIQVLLAVLLFKFVYKIEWYNALVGYIIIIILSGITEMIGLIIMSMVLGIDIAKVNVDEQIKFLFTIAPRVLETSFIIFLFKTGFVFVNLRAIKFTKSIIKNISMMYLLLGLCLFQILVFMQYFAFDFPVVKTVRDIRFMIASVGMMTILSILIICFAVKIAKQIEKQIEEQKRKTTKFEQNEHLHNLLRTRTLLYEVKSGNMAIEEIIEIITNEMIIGGGLVRSETKKN
jgi:hypothetical protein